jgi:hypothetical protein
MARNTTSNSGIWLIGGLVLLIAMCRGAGKETPTDPPIAPVSESAAVSPPQPETMYVAARVLNQRSSPNGAVAGNLSGGASINVYERSGSWARVSPEGASPLWVSSSLLCSGSGCYKPPTPRESNYSPSSKRSRSNYIDETCPCSGNQVCIGPRGGRYCITSGGNKRYGV